MVEKNADSAPANLIITLSPRRSYLTKLAPAKDRDRREYNWPMHDYFCSPVNSTFGVGRQVAQRSAFYSKCHAVPWRAPIRQGRRWLNRNHPIAEPTSPSSTCWTVGDPAAAPDTEVFSQSDNHLENGL